MIYSIFFIIGGFRGNDAPACSGDSEPSGLNKCKEGTCNGATTDTSWSSSDNMGKTHALSGSFCATQTKSYTFELKGTLALQLTVDGTSDNSNSNHECQGTNSHCTVQKSLNANQCVPYVAQMFGSGGGIFCKDPDMTIYIDGNRPSYTTFISCQKSNCRYAYTGSSCQYKVDDIIYCHGLGTQKRGKSDDITCNCVNGISYDNDKFCELSSTTLFFSNTHLTMSTQDDFSSSPTTKEVKLDTINGDFDDPYTTVTISGRIHIPQKRKITFKIETLHKAKLTILTTNDKQVFSIGELEDKIHCDPTKTDKYTYTSNEYEFSRGKYKIRIEYVPGCSLNDHYMALYWKIAKLTNSDGFSGNWEKIKEKYIGI